MLTLDERALERIREEKIVQENLARIAAYNDAALRNSIYCENNLINPTNAEAQIGKPMSSNELEKRLKKLCPKLIFKHSTLITGKNSGKKALYYEKPDGELLLICPYEDGIMPEHSIMNKKREEVWDGKTTHINRKDLPEMQWDGSDFIRTNPNQALPGMRIVDQPWNEVKRGWRTVLLHLMMTGFLEGFITLDAIEKEFGQDSRAEWKSHTGRSAESLTPW